MADARGRFTIGRRVLAAMGATSRRFASGGYFRDLREEHTSQCGAEESHGVD
jgi:hypothetical protein